MEIVTSEVIKIFEVLGPLSTGYLFVLRSTSWRHDFSSKEVLLIMVYQRSPSRARLSI